MFTAAAAKHFQTANLLIFNAACIHQAYAVIDVVTNPVGIRIIERTGAIVNGRIRVDFATS